MDESVNVVFSNSLSNSLSPLDMNVLKGKVSVEIIQNAPADCREVDDITWSDSPAQPDYRPCQSGGRSLQAKGCSLGRIPRKAHFRARRHGSLE